MLLLFIQMVIFILLEVSFKAFYVLVANSLINYFCNNFSGTFIILTAYSEIAFYILESENGS